MKTISLTNGGIIPGFCGMWTVIGVCLLLVSGCSSTPKNEQGADAQKVKADSKNVSMTKEQILEQKDVKGHAPTVYAQPLESVREAALRALTFVGCEIKKQEPFFVSGRRPNKVGFFVGSGGETVKVFLYPEAEATTHVWVDTDLSLVGMAGQQSWNDKVIAEMNNILNKQPAAK